MAVRAKAVRTATSTPVRPIRAQFKWTLVNFKGFIHLCRRFVTPVIWISKSIQCFFVPIYNW